MPQTLAVPPPTHREATPVRTCSRCGCYLRSFHDSDYCEQHDKQAGYALEAKQGLELVADVAAISDSRFRQQGFDALSELSDDLTAELMEEAGIAA
jgi:hypothetical protein